MFALRRQYGPASRAALPGLVATYRTRKGTEREAAGARVVGSYAPLLWWLVQRHGRADVGEAVSTAIAAVYDVLSDPQVPLEAARLHSRINSHVTHSLRRTPGYRVSFGSSVPDSAGVGRRRVDPLIRAMPVGDLDWRVPDADGPVVDDGLGEGAWEEAVDDEPHWFLHEAIRRLRPEDHALLRARYGLFGARSMSEAELAAHAGLDLLTVRKRLQRARGRLRDELGVGAGSGASTVP